MYIKVQYNVKCWISTMKLKWKWKLFSSPTLLLIFLCFSLVFSQVNKMSLIEVPQDTVRFALRSRCPHSGDRMFVCEAPDKERRDMWVAQIKNMLNSQQDFLRALQSPIDFQRRAQQGDEVTWVLLTTENSSLSRPSPHHSALLTTTKPPINAVRPPYHFPLSTQPMRERKKPRLTANVFPRLSPVPPTLTSFAPRRHL